MELTKLHQRLGALVLTIWELEEQNIAFKELAERKPCEGCDGKCGEEREAEPE